MVAHLLWGQAVGGSNPPSPTQVQLTGKRSRGADPDSWQFTAPPSQCEEREDASMARTWWSITVELIEGTRGQVLAATRPRLRCGAEPHLRRPRRRHRIGVWSLGPAHLREFRLDDETRIGIPDADWGHDDILDERTTKLSRLGAGDRFLYVFDFGDGWHHLCVVGDSKIDPLDDSASSQRRHCPTSAGASYPTNTDAAGPTTTAADRSRRTRGARTCRRSSRGGAKALPCTPTDDEQSTTPVEFWAIVAFRRRLRAGRGRRDRSRRVGRSAPGRRHPPR